MITKIKREDAYKRTILKPSFSDISDIESLDDVLIRQERAREALDFGLSIDKYGYNIYLSGEPSSRRKVYLKSVLKKYAEKKEIPHDLCYINNFDEDNKNKPVFLKFNAGNGSKFKDAIDSFAKQTKKDLEKLFNGSNHRKEIEALELKYDNESFELIKKYSDLAKEIGFVLSMTNGSILPFKCDSRGKILSEKKINKLIMENNDKYREDIQRVNSLLLELSHEDLAILKKKEEALNNFDKNKSSEIINKNFKPIREEFVDNAIDECSKKKIINYLKGIEEYILDNLDLFVDTTISSNPSEAPIDDKTKFKNYFNLISVNVLINNKDLKHAPVIFTENLEDEFDLLGGVMYEIDKNSYSTDTDYKKIKAGSLLKANGGYLIIDLNDIESDELWHDLKKALSNKKVKFTGKTSSTVMLADNLEPEPIDINVKVILLGSANLYYALFENDRTFRELFEIHAKFDYQIDRDSNNEKLYARLLKKYCEEESLKPLSYDATCRVIEYASKISGSQNKLVASYSDIYKLLIEADKLASIGNSDNIDFMHVVNAIDEKLKRVNNASKYRDEMIKNNEIVLSVDDEKVGEVNALSVIDYFEFNLGNVSKLTANTYKSKKYSIASSDKEGHMSGPLHDKALNVVFGFLGEIFGKEKEFPYSVNITFEQNYGGVDGDSATLAKTCAILSSLSNAPIKQKYGITGSMNQKGDVQAIGGVNEKIEGFFDLCKTKEFKSGGGVIIPRANINDLMLKSEVLDAIENNTFNIYAIDTIEDAVELLTGKSFEDICELIKKTY